MVFDLWTPLGGDVLEGGGAHHREADEEDVRLRVGQRPQPAHDQQHHILTCLAFFSESGSVFFVKS